LVNRQSNIKLIGTPDYIAPEIINRVSINNMTIDWWSFGVIMYEVLVGVRPFSGETIEEVVENIIHFNIEWPEIGY
jgi:serum/glucocorticoid-regulated kinase 2